MTLGDLIVRIGADPGNFQDVMKGIGDTVDATGERIANMAEKLTLLAEGLAFTEALKEFAQEALTTFGNIEKVSISLTALTGSAEEAASSIERLKQVAISDALSFPALAEATQRMTAFGFEADKIPGLLQAAADAAAATNKDFGEVADKIDRIVLSGTASGKQLAGLGLSMKDLGDVMGVTADQVTKVFKSLDEGLRADIITSALQKYEGVAAEVAQGIAGQWKNLQTQIEFVFEDIGKALAPIVGLVVEFMRTDIVPYIHSLVDWFNNLSTPVKEAVAGFGLLLVALVPIATALAGIGLAITGLGVAIPAIVGIGSAALGIVPWVAGIAVAIYAVVKAAQELQSWIDQHPQAAKYETLLSAIPDVMTAATSSLFHPGSEGPETSWRPMKGPGESSTSGSGEGTGPADPAIIAGLVAQQQAAAAAAAEYKAMQEQEIAFHNSVVDLWNSLPATYDQYLSTLENGGKTAKAMGSQIETDLNRASTVMMNMSGAPLKAMQDWVDGLQRMQTQIKQFADTDAFYQAAQKIGQEIDKFPDQVKELSAMDDGLKQFFQTMADGAANVPDALNKIDVAALATKLLEAQKQLDDSGKKLSDTFTKFYDTYEQRTRQAIGITDDFKVKFGELAAITADANGLDLSARLPANILEAYRAAVLLNKEAKDLGVNFDQDGNASKKIVTEFEDFASNSNTGLEAVQLAWEHVSGAVTKLAKTDLPAAIEAYDTYIAKLKEENAARGAILAMEEAELKIKISLAQENGTDATAEIIQLTQKQYETKALADAATALGTVYVGVRKAFDDAFASLSKGLADAIVNSKNLGDVFVNVGKQIATAILDTVIKGALVPLQDELNKTGGLFDTLGKQITSGLGKATGLGGGGGLGPNANTPTFDPVTGREIYPTGPQQYEGMDTPPYLTHDGVGSGETATQGSGLPGGDSQTGNVGSGEVGGATSGTSSGGSASSAGGLLSSISNVANIVGAAATVISGIVQGFQMAHLNNLMGEVEISTRQIANVVALNGGETIFAYSKLAWQDLQVIVGELGNLHDADAEAISVLEQIRDGSGAGGGNPIVKELGNVEDRISEVRDAIAQLISTVEQSGGMGGGGSVGQAGDLVDAIKRSNLQLADAIQSGIKSGLSSFTSALNNPNSTGVGPLGSPVLKDDPAPAPLDPLTSLLDAAQHAAGPGGSVGSVFQSPLSFAGMSPEAQSALAGVSDTTFTLSQGNPYTNPVLPDLQVPQPGGLSQSAFQSIPIPDLQGGTHPLGVADIGSAGRILDGIQQELDGAVQQLGILMAQPKENAAYISKVKTVIQQLLQAKLALEPYGMAWGGRGLALMAGSAVGMPGNPFTGGDSYQPPAPPTIPMNAILPGIPFNPIGNYGAGSGVTNPSMPITVNALDPSAKGVGDALIQYLRSNGMKV